MRKLLILAFAIIAFGIAYGQNQQDTVIVEPSYGNSTLKPVLIHRNTLVVNQADSIYLINNLRYAYYEKLRLYIEDNSNFTADDIIIKYEQLLKENELAYNLLRENCEKSSELTDNFIEETKQSLELTSTTLNQTQLSLENANESLEQANKLLKKSNKKRIWSGLSAGFGGLGVGLLVGLLVAN